MLLWTNLSHYNKTWCCLHCSLTPQSNNYNFPNQFPAHHAVMQDHLTFACFLTSSTTDEQDKQRTSQDWSERYKTMLVNKLGLSNIYKGKFFKIQKKFVQIEHFRGCLVLLPFFKQKLNLSQISDNESWPKW